MATSTSSSKAKTKKSNKKPAVKTQARTTKAAATRAKKTTAKAATKSTKKAVKPVTKAAKTTKTTVRAATPSKVVIKRTDSRLAFLGRAQVQLGVVFAALAVLAGVFMNTTSAQVLLGHLTKDELASKSGTVLTPAAHILYEVDYRWLLVALLSLAAVLAFLRGTRYKALEDRGLAARVQPLRWIDYGITSAFAFAVVSLLNGLQDSAALKFGAVSLLLAAYLGWVFERENAATNKPARSVYLASVVSTVVPLLMLATTMYATWMYGLVRSPWYAYASAAVFAVFVLATTRIQWIAFKHNNGTHDFAFVDRNYNRLAVVSKVALAVILIVGLYDK